MLGAAPPPLAPMSDLQQQRRAAADPLSASSVERRNRKPQDLGAALASLDDRSSSSIMNNNTGTGTAGRNSGGKIRANSIVNKNIARLFLEDHMEEGLGVGQFEGTEDDALSVQQHQPELPGTRRPKKAKRSSLIERSKAFQEKLNNFMTDYSSKDSAMVVANNLGDTSPNTSMMDEDTSNRFPTRKNDIRHVDQSVNLMDTESARYQYSDDDDDAGDDDADYDDSKFDDDDDDVYANYTTGFTTQGRDRDGSPRKAKNRRASRRGSLQMVLENGIDYLVNGASGAAATVATEDDTNGALQDPATTTVELPSGPTKKFLILPDDATERSDYTLDSCFPNLRKNKNHSEPKRCVRWTLVVLMFLTAATWLVFCIPFFTDDNMPMKAAATVAPVAAVDALAVVDTPASGTVVDATAAAVMAPEPTTTSNDIVRRKAVLGHVLMEAFLDPHSKDLNLSNPNGRKAMEWMAGYDSESMALLDAFHFEHGVKTAANLRTGNDVLDPANHYSRIMEKYVQATFWFVAHPDAKVGALHL